MNSTITRYFDTLHALALATEVHDGRDAVPLADGIATAIAMARKTHAAGNKLLFIGNGGSAGITSHMAVDYSKNGQLRSMALNDASMLTCLGNDFGYEHVFAKQIEFHGRAGDLLIAISSSGKSSNILQAVIAARATKMAVITLSGFTSTNPLRSLGDLNFYVASPEYGFVELTHASLLHALLDLSMGWKPSD